VFGKRLKELRERNNFSMDRLVDIYNMKFNGKMNKSTLSRYENNLQEPMYTVVVNLAEIFGVSVDYLSGAKDNLFAIKGVIPIETRRFPLEGEIACGEPIYANREYEAYVEASSDIDADFCLKAKGDSMINARIFDGDVVFIKSQPDVENGDIAAIRIGDEVTLKRVYKYENRIELRAENPLYSPLNYEGSELDQVQILGKAVIFQSAVI